MIEHNFGKFDGRLFVVWAWEVVLLGLSANVNWPVCTRKSVDLM